MNIIGPVNGLGYGVVATNVALAFDRAGFEPALWPIGRVVAPPRHRAAISRMIARTHTYDRHKSSLKIWHLSDLAQQVGKGMHCAFAFFELDRLKPAELHHLASQDVVFAPSRWAREVLLANGIAERSVRIARPGVDTGVFSFEGTSHAASTGGEPTVFVNVGKWEVRKGHDVLVEAFARAFSRTDNVRLIMNCHNPCLPPELGQRYNERFAAMYQNRLGDQVRIIDKRLPWQAGVAALMRSADCGVFPSRGEGWNLEVLEMMALGKPVILTDYAAHTEYATPENARLVQVEKTEPAVDGVWFKDDKLMWCGGEPGRWAYLGEGQIEQLVDHLRDIHRARQERRLIVNRAGMETARRLSWDNTVTEIVAGIGG